MHTISFSEYIGYVALWMVPFIGTIKLLLMFKKSSCTMSGRPIDKTEGRDTRLESRIWRDEEIFHQKMGNISLKVSEMWNTRYAYLAGDILARSQAVLIMIPGIDEVDYEACRWLYKREYYYMINHVDVKIQMIKVLSMAIAALSCSVIAGISFAGSIAITLCTGLCLESVCRHIVENRADSFARDHSSKEQLRGGWRFLVAAHKESLKLPLAERWGQCLMQPNYFFRMKRIENALVKQALSWEAEEESIEGLQKLLAKNNYEETRFIEAKKQQVLRWIDADED